MTRPIGEGGQIARKIVITRAIISVHDKTGLGRLARVLHQAGVEIVSTGGSAAAIAAADVPVTPVEVVTGFPEVLGGRVKTLHPAIHAGLLADSCDPMHLARLDELRIAAFQLVVCNLYPFVATAAAGGSGDECVDQIDIGGPAMIRAAAKNHASVAVVTSPDGYGEIERALGAGGFTLDQRRRLAARAFGHTAAYEAAVASWFASVYAPDDVARQTGWPDLTAGTWRRAGVLRYGENPHQRAALYLPGVGYGGAGYGGAGYGGAGYGGASAGGTAGVAAAELLHGKSMSYNNYVDAQAGWRAVGEFARACVAIMKHSNPCGIAIASDIARAHEKARACDPGSAFGGVIAANSVVTAEFAAQVAGFFTEVIVAPGFDADALAILTRKKDLRLLRCAAPSQADDGDAGAGMAGSAGAVQWRQIGGGLLAQATDAMTEPGDRPAGWRLVAGREASDDALADLEFAWRACRAVKSNAIVLAAGLATVGIGMGQVNRVDAARLAVWRAGGRAAGSVAASDAYFPFPDGLVVLAEAGVRAIAEPGGSVRDDQVIAAARAAGVSLYFTGVRHFSH